MITIIRSDAQTGGELFTFAGLAADEKPVTSYSGTAISNGSVFIEIDTGKSYMYDAEGEEWHEQAGGGSGGGITAADVVAIVQLAVDNVPIPRHVITGETTYELEAQWGHKYVFDDTLEELTVTIPTAPTDVEATITIEVTQVNAEGLILTLPADLIVYGSSPIAGEAYELNLNESLRAFANSYPLPEEEEEEGGE